MMKNKLYNRIQNKKKMNYNNKYNYYKNYKMKNTK